MSIVNECMTVNLQIGVWTGYRLDKDASAKVTADAAASQDAARVNKHLIAKESLAPINTAANAVRLHFYNDTLPWKDNGDRVLTRKRYMTFMVEHAALVEKFHAAVQTFIEETYPAACDRAAFRMGTLFKASDYPHPEALRSRFYVNLDIDAIAEASDFRVTMEAEQVEQIRATMEAALQQRMGRAMQDVWTRLSDTLGHFAERMGSDGVFRESTIRNLEEIVDLLPDLNVLEDENLEQIRQQVATFVIGYDAKTLRTDKNARATVSAEAQRIMDDMAGFMAAFGGES
jgi:hypothetical protein